MMKITEQNMRKSMERTRAEQMFTYEDLTAMIDAPAERTGIIKEHPFASVAIAAAIALVPTSGIAFTGMLSSASEFDTEIDDAMLVAKYANGQKDANSNADDSRVSFTIDLDGPGHIEAVSNCSVVGENVVFSQPDSMASVKMVSDGDVVYNELSVAGNTMATGDNIVLLDPNGDYPDMKVTFVEAEHGNVDSNNDGNFESEAPSGESFSNEGNANKAFSGGNDNNWAPEETYSTPAPAPEQEPAPEPACNPAPAYQAPEAPALPNSGMPQNGMNADERAEAEAIFNAYNNWRAARGLSRVSWSEDCANMAWGSATGCASRRSLVHRLGIPGHLQTTYSDILQYATWKMDPYDAVSRWENSDGHRRMMQCNTASAAGVAAYNSNGVWFYVIVYNFEGTNQSGN